jgi:RND family efflux transporter MFP subunit
MKRKYPVIGGTLVALLLAAGGFYYWQTSNSASTTTTRQTTTVVRGTLTASVSAAGNISAPETADLSFGVGDARVTKVNAAVGDQVQAGAVLAEANADQYQDAVANAELNLESAQLTLAELQEPATAADLASAGAQVNAAQATYDSAAASLQELESGASALDLYAAQASLTAAQESYKSALAKSEMTDQQIIIARASLETARIDLEGAQASYNLVAWQDNATNSSAAKELQAATIAYESAKASYDLTMAEMNNSELASAKAALASAQSNLQDLAEGATAEELATARAAVETAQANLLQAKSDLQELEDGATAQELLDAQASVNSAQASLDEAKRTLASASIVAPFDGVIASVNTFAGQTATANSTVISLVNLDKLQAQVTLSEIDVASVKAGQNVELTFDALGDAVYTGTVTSVSPVGTSSSGVVNYTVTIALTNPDASILPGMTALANIITEQKDNTLYVSSRAVKTQNNRKVATLLLEGNEIPLIVQVGMTNSSFTEITGATMADGTAVDLQEGDTFVLNATTTSSSTSGAGGMGGPPGAGFLP